MQNRAKPIRLLLIDNYDSFTFNLVDYVTVLGAQPIVRRHDEIDVAGCAALSPDGIVLSPGPGGPHEAGNSAELTRYAAERRLPLLGVCLGHQVLGEVFGARTVRAPAPMHGKTSLVHHDDSGLFAGLPNPFTAARYHSLTLAPDSIRSPLRMTARSGDGVVMAIEHSALPLFGVQFHPESIASTHGHDLLRAFLDCIVRVSDLAA